MLMYTVHISNTDNQSYKYISTHTCTHTIYTCFFFFSMAFKDISVKLHNLTCVMPSHISSNQAGLFTMTTNKSHLSISTFNQTTPNLFITALCKVNVHDHFNMEPKKTDSWRNICQTYNPWRVCLLFIGYLAFKQIIFLRCLRFRLFARSLYTSRFFCVLMPCVYVCLYSLRPWFDKY